MTPRGLVIFAILWLGMVAAIMVVANIGPDDGAVNNLEFDMQQANTPPAR